MSVERERERGGEREIERLGRKKKTFERTFLSTRSSWRHSSNFEFKNQLDVNEMNFL